MQISPANRYLHATVWPQTVTCRYHLALPKRNVTSQGLLDIEFPFILLSWVQVLNFKGLNHICMSRSEVRPWHADISWPVISACPKFRKIPKSINLGGGFRNTWLHATVWPQTRTCKGSGNFGAAYPRFPKVLCIDLRPGHARGLGILCYLPQIPKSTLHATVWPQTRTYKGSWNFAGLVAFVLVNMCQQNKPWRSDNFLSPTSILGLWKKLFNKKSSSW